LIVSGAAIGLALTPAGPGAAWVWPLPGSWCRRTMAKSAWKVSRAAEQHSPCSCPLLRKS